MQHKKVVEICIRVSPNEKKILQRKAKKSGLNLSSYLRKVGLEKELYSVPDKDFYKIYLQISNLKNEIYKLQTDEIIVYLEAIKKNFLDIYNKQITVEKEDGNN